MFWYFGLKECMNCGHLSDEGGWVSVHRGRGKRIRYIWTCLDCLDNESVDLKEIYKKKIEKGEL